MAERAATVIPPTPSIIPRSSTSLRIKWTGLLNGDSGGWLTLADLADKTIQVFGVFGAGGTVVIQGSNDGGTTAATLTNEQGDALSFTAAGLRLILQNPESIRPLVTGGDGDTSLTAIVYGVGR